MSNYEKYSNGDYQRAVGQMVEKNVNDCVSGLISDMYRASVEGVAFEEWNDELQNVITQYTDNSEEIEELEEKIEELETLRDGMIEELEDIAAESQDCETLEETFLYRWAAYQIDHTEKVFTDLIDTAEREKSELEEDPNEAYEHWTVSSWLGEQLKNRGQMVEDIHGLTVWGRVTTGQAILLDSVICSIYDTVYGDTWKEEAEERRIEDERRQAAYRARTAASVQPVSVFNDCK